MAEPNLLTALRATDTAAVYSCFNFRLASELSLSELSEAPLNDPRPFVTVRLGNVPESLPGARAPFRGLQASDTDALLTLPGVGRFLVSNGEAITLDPDSAASERTLRLFLLGTALGILCHQRGLLPLHANAIVAHGDAFAFAGQSGAGKSTLAAEFQRRGYRMLADDVCMVDVDARGSPVAWPGIPRLKLWADAADRFGHDRAALDRVLDDAPKYHVPAAASADLGPAPLRRLYLLSRADDDNPRGIRRLTGQEAMAAVMAHTYRGFCLEPMGLGARHFRQCAGLLSSTRVYAASRQWGFDGFEAEVDRLEQHLFEEEPE